MHAWRALILAGSTVALAACGGGDKVPSGDPAGSLRSEMRGYSAPVGVMFGVDEKPYWVQAAIKGFRPVKDGDRPAKLETREGIGGCLFTRPAATEAVAKVMVDDSPMAAPVYAFSQRAIGERAELMVETYKSQGKAGTASDIAADQLDAVDVAVTERAKPVYLVLASNGGGLLFNIHLAPGAKVSHVAVIGGRRAAVANLEPGVPVEFLTDNAAGMCDAAPMRIPADHWNFMSNVKEAGGSLDEALEKNYEYQRRWSAFHLNNFGVASEPGAIGATTTAHVLVGPLPAKPEERAVYRPLKGANVLITRADYTLIGSPEDYKTLNRQLVRDAATQAAGGDLKALYKGGK